MKLTTIIEAVTLAGLALVSVSLWTARVALTAQRRRTAAAIMAAVEATVFVVAFSRLLTGLDSPLSVTAYAIGVAGGTALALIVEDRLQPAPGRDGTADLTGSVEPTDVTQGGASQTASTPEPWFGGPITLISMTIAPLGEAPERTTAGQHLVDRHPCD